MATYTSSSSKRSTYKDDSTSIDTYVVGSSSKGLTLAGKSNGDTIQIDGLSTDYNFKSSSGTLAISRIEHPDQAIKIQLSKLGGANGDTLQFSDGIFNADYVPESGSDKASINLTNAASKVFTLTNQWGVLEGKTYTLTTGADSFTGTTGKDSFTGTYNSDVTDTFGATDSIKGSAGTDDTLTISHLVDVAITPPDTLWQHISNIEKVVINTTGNGAQTIITGSAFKSAFSHGVDLTTTTTGSGAITLTMTSFTHDATITTTSFAGAQTIVTGSGDADVTANSGAGALVIYGKGLVSASATTTGAGAQTIGDASSGGAHLVTVNATSSSGAQTITSTSNSAATVHATSSSGAQTITTGAGSDSVTVTTSAALNTITTNAGNDTITLHASAAAAMGNTITAGAGKDTINLVSSGLTASDTIVIGNKDSGITIAKADSITGFATASDTLKMGTVGTTGNYAEASHAVANFAAALAAAKTDLSHLTGAERYSFQWDDTNGYLFDDTDGNGSADQVVVLVGITDVGFAAGNIIA